MNGMIRPKVGMVLSTVGRLPKERQAEIRELVKDIADSPAEARALFDVAVRRFTPAGVSARTGVSVQRIYRLREEFYERLPL